MAPAPAPVMAYQRLGVGPRQPVSLLGTPTRLPSCARRDPPPVRRRPGGESCRRADHVSLALASSLWGLEAVVADERLGIGFAPAAEPCGAL